ncbi:hypothetical protein LCGC14_2595280 [marine sediment metagenome]|uniref:Uncharacterized protein n=1 Tax=marine sediment metagenome TaxID=412755 RepID=A0A0F9AYB6_9ZZZZ
MKRWIIRILMLSIILLLVIGFVQVANAYEPMTESEVENYLGSITLEELFDFVIKYDLVEHTVPEVSGGDFIILLSGRDVYIEYQNKMKVKIGHLEYNLEMENKVYEGFVPREGRLKTIGISSGVGALVGIILMLLIL